MKKSTIIIIYRCVFLSLGVYLAAKWTGIDWWKAWILFGLFATSATLHLKKQ